MNRGECNSLPRHYAWRNSLAGELLADDMGMGKTHSALALIVCAAGPACEDISTRSRTISASSVRTICLGNLSSMLIDKAVELSGALNQARAVIETERLGLPKSASDMSHRSSLDKISLVSSQSLQVSASSFPGRMREKVRILLITDFTGDRCMS